MYVVETATGSIETMKITIMSPTGGYWAVDVLPEFSIDKLKLMALSHFYNPVDSIKVADRYKLILVSQCRPLPDEGTIRDEDLQENDELLLLRKRIIKQSNSETPEEKEEKSRGPTDNEIQKETSSLPKRNVNSVAEEATIPVDFHTELRKILVSLVRASEKLLRYHSELAALFKEMAEGDHINECRESIDRSSLKQLTDMGFPEAKALEALRLNSNLSEAMDWLLVHSADGPHKECPQASKSKPSPPILHKFSKMKLAETVHPAPGPSKVEPEVLKPPEGASANTEQSRIVEMIRCFRAYKRKIFRPNMAALTNLKEMGFAEPDVLDALRINGNNQDTACDWLLSEKKQNFDDVEEGLDPNGPIYTSIMTNPVVQLGLCNPKTFLALLHMLENPTSACRWLNDPDTAPILSQIFRIYHAEKHSLQLARPFPQ